eukprot:SAG22_NODE_791_length_7210_cov_40.904936_3_plen_158_part_00
MGCCGSSETPAARGSRQGGRSDPQWRNNDRELERAIAASKTDYQRGKSQPRQSFGGAGQKLGGAGVGAESGVDARQVAAMAAMQRHADGSGGESGAHGRANQAINAKGGSLQKQELLGRIDVLYDRKKEKRPFALGSLDVAGLQKHLAKMQADPKFG